MRIYVARNTILERVLKRKKQEHDTSPSDVDIKGTLKSILMWANRFVPSESGSILLDDPILDAERKKPGRLYFVACYGKGSRKLAGSVLPVSMGIAGKTYRTGEPCISRYVEKDRDFYSEIDKITGFKTHSIICVPIQIKNTTIGVLELINKLDGINYDETDLELLKIFAGYTSTLIQNFLDAKRFGELSIRDNLTGLYNDRFFFDHLLKEVKRAVHEGKDLGLIFMDLDHFKEVNDTYGHLAGSELLKELGFILLNMTEGQIIPARYGGDEFAIIVPGRGIEYARRYAERLRKSIAEHVFLSKDDGNIPPLRIKNLITASLGVASLRRNVKQGLRVREIRDALIKAADTAMYMAKENGKNMVCVAKGFFSAYTGHTP